MIKKCPLLVRVCQKGIKCKHCYGGNFYFERDINSGSGMDFDIYDSKEKKRKVEQCYLY